jgi:predicted amidohydrolase YtcJ
VIRLWPESHQRADETVGKVFFCLCFALTALRAVAASPSKIAIIHVSVIDVRAGTIAPDMTVLVQGDRITEVRPSKNNERLSAKDIQVIDGRGKFPLPGLWDMHVHSAGDDRALHLFIAHGITGIRDMAGDAAKLADARRRITSGELTGPRLSLSRSRSVEFFDESFVS